jgi:hypothetical protein
LLSAAAKILSMYCFSDRYKRRVGSYFFLDLRRHRYTPITSVA